MKVLLHSYAFAPGIGGIESSSLLIIRALREANHEVRVVTATPEGKEPAACEANLSVTRNPSLEEARDSIQWCDCIIQNHVSFSLLKPALFIRKPIFVHFQTWWPKSRNPRAQLRKAWRQLLLIRCQRSANSEALAKTLWLPTRNIGNPYDDHLFYEKPGVVARKDCLFVGRLVSDKGVHILVEAFRMLQLRDNVPTLTIVGSGPEEAMIQDQVASLGLSPYIHFEGFAAGETLADLYRDHRVLIIPSIWDEPFGIVALEGAACGCTVLGSNGGGLPQAIGPCGTSFSHGNASALADKIELALKKPENIQGSAEERNRHLDYHRPQTFVQRLLQPSDSNSLSAP